MLVIVIRLMNDQWVIVYWIIFLWIYNINTRNCVDFVDKKIANVKILLIEIILHSTRCRIFSKQRKKKEEEKPEKTKQKRLDSTVVDKNLK